MDMVSGVVGIEYSHFYIHEDIGSDVEGADRTPDFRTAEPVLTTPGQLTVVSCVQSHDARVTLMLTEAEPVRQPEQWQLLGMWPYLPISSGRMSMSGPTTGPATPAADWLPGSKGYAPALQLDPATAYTVHVCARGRQDSRARYEAAMAREEFGLHEGFEDYMVAFIPADRRPPTADRRPPTADRRPPTDSRRELTPPACVQSFGRRLVSSCLVGGDGGSVRARGADECA
ncbi:hypothetical protein GCM10010277_88250 [Streptomyces longisporoflavus]|nr:hypothetical protein GCM10010277_88250 [Streptomyces longisporoflavus]